MIVRFIIALLLVLIALEGCGPAPKPLEAKPRPAAPEPAPTSSARPPIRITGLVRAVRVNSIQTPQIAIIIQGNSQSNRLTLVTLAANGAKVKEGDVLAEFDNTRQYEETMEVEAKYDDLGHQVEQKGAQNQSEAEKRVSDLKQAEADLAKALIQLKKGPVLSDIDLVKNKIKAESAQARVESLRKSHAARMRAEEAARRVLQLQQQRQKVALDRSNANAKRMVVTAPLAGMVVLENIWKQGTMGHPQEGDQMWPGQPLLKIFDPTEMIVFAQVGEPDNARLAPGMRAKVLLDAYPEVVFEAVFESSSPVATTALGSPVKNFQARFKLLQADPRLLPDLSAAVIVGM